MRRLRAWQEGRDDGGLVLTDVFARVGGSCLAPDAAWWAHGRKPAIGPGALDVVADRFVEVLPPSTRDNDYGADVAALIA